MQSDPHSIFLQTLADFVVRHGQPGRLLVGFSGGADSTALLLLTRDYCRDHDLPLMALHVHHGMHPQADHWSGQCRRTCEQLGVACEVVAAGGDDPPTSETGARAIRYDVFEQQLKRGDVLLLAHHDDDQTETMLLNLFRGTGLDGLSGMPPDRPLGSGYLLRPVLACSKAQLEQHVSDVGLTWIEDPMNRDVGSPRNALRHHILPEIDRHWPSARTAISRAIGQLNQARVALDSTLTDDLIGIQGPESSTVDLDAWLKLPSSRRPLVLRYWLRNLGLPTPDHRHLAELQSQILGSRADASPVVSWPGAEVRRFRTTLYAMRPLVIPEKDVEIVFHDWTLELPAGLGLFRWCPESADEGSPPSLTIRFRRGGERLCPRGQTSSRSLKNLLQEAAVPPWERPRIPLIFRNRELLAVGDLCGSETWHQLQQDLGMNMVWRRG